MEVEREGGGRVKRRRRHRRMRRRGRGGSTEEDVAAAGSFRRRPSPEKKLQKSLNEESTKLQEMTDPTIRGTFATESLRTAVELTLNCLVNDPKERPSIDDILWNLQYSVQVQDGWASSENLSTQS